MWRNEQKFGAYTFSVHIYGTCDISLGGVRSTRIRFLWLRFTTFSPCVRWPRARSPLLTFDDGRRQFTMCSAVVSLNSHKLLSCTTGVRHRAGFSITVMVTITVRVSRSIYGYGFTLKLEGNRHRTFLWKIETRLLSTPPFPHAIDMYLSGGRGSHYLHKGGKYDINININTTWWISSTMIKVCMFSSRNMTAHLVHWSLAWFDAYM